MRKALSILLAGLMLLALLSACVSDEASPNNPGSTNPGSPDDGGTSPALLPSPSPEAVVEEDPDLEFVDGNWKFKETRNITVEVFERNQDIRTPAEDNYFTDWIKSELLKTHNVQITEYISMPRWEEDSTIPLWLAGGDCPDVCITYNFQAIQEYANMGAVHNLAPLVHENKDRLPNLWDLLGETNMYGARNPETGEIYWMETMKADSSRINTFVREDWLTALGISAPTTNQEYYDMLCKFRDNAELLLPGQADKMIPFMIGQDVGWGIENMALSYVDDAISTRDQYIYGYDDRHFMWPGYKEGIRELNKWYNEGLVFKEFSLYKAGDATLDDLIKTGYVGSYIGNWDYMYRNNPSIQVTLQQEVGPDAAYIAIDPFVNNAGKHYKALSSSFDRKIFFPLTNAEPKASIYFVDFISRPEVIQFLQLGVEGVNYDIVDGVPVIKQAVVTEKDADGKDVKGEDGMPIILDDSNRNYIMNSPQNIDYTMTINGLYPEGLTAGALATGFIGTDPKYILEAVRCAQNDGVPGLNLNLGEITSESGMGEGLKTKRDACLNLAVKASVADFDKVYDDGYNEYLAAGGQAIIDERKAAYDRSFGADSD